MPYINMEDRKKFENIIDEVLDIEVMTTGELNYLLTCICQCYQVNQGRSYTTHNDIVGVLECVKQEWYRRQTVPYEQEKIEDNGDVKV